VVGDPLGGHAMRARGGFWPLRDIPVVLWLLSAVVAAVAHQALPAPRWLLIHLLLLGAVSHAILVWSRYFTEALLHTAPAPRGPQSVRLGMLNLGVVLVVVGVLADVWPATVAGATAVGLAVVWHGWTLGRLLRGALGSRFAGTVRYYVAAACLLPVGATLGVILARGVADPWHARLVLAHAAINLLGWIGLTVLGTLVTLWPTILRTRIAEGAERRAAVALPVLLAGVLLSAGASLAGQRALSGLGILVYLAGVVLTLRAVVDAVRRKRPESFAGWSVLAGLCWLVVGLAWLAVGVAASGSWHEAHEAFERVTPFLVVGFAAQVLLGALSYLVPVALGGGPTPVRAANAGFDRGGPLRLVLVNAALVLAVFPLPSAVLVAVTLVALGGLAAFLPLMFLAMRAHRRAKADPSTSAGAPPARRGQMAGLAGVGLAVLVLAVAVGVSVDPTAAGTGSETSAAAGVVGTGHTTKVEVTAADMRFTPSTIQVPAGDRLVIVVHNTDEDEIHDLVLDTGADTGRLSPGESGEVDAGVIGRDVDGWCSVLGHRQMGMVLQIEVIAGAGTEAGEESGGTSHDMGSHDHGTPSSDDSGDSDDAASRLDFMADPGEGFTARDATLPPVDQGRVHRRTFTVRDVLREVAPGVTQQQWTYDGTAPGPILHGRVGDVFVIRLVNDGSVSHSIDFHAGSLAPDRPMRTIAPGESLVYRFRATRAGIWMYHCSTMPMSMHIANGLYGAVVIDPPDLPPVDRSYVLVQSELYLGAQAGSVDPGKVTAEEPDAVVFNGYANQYDHRPLVAKVGERVRIWVLDAGPNRASSFHVVGGQFDTVYSEGAYLLKRGSSGGAQSLGLQAAQGGFVELVFPEAGHYPFVSHVMVDAERGAHGIFAVTK